MKKRKILLLQADTTQTLPMARELCHKGFEVHVVVSSKLTYGYGCRFVSRRYIFEDYENVDMYFEFVLSLVKENTFTAIIPMADHGAIVLSKYRDELLKYSQFKVPEYETFERGFDKHKLMEVCLKGNYPHPRTVTVRGKDITASDVKNLCFPVLIKPDMSCGARGITPAHNQEQLFKLFPKVVEAYGNCHIQEYIPAGGHQVEVQIYINEQGELVQSSVITKFRWYPNNGGSSCCNKSSQNEKIVNILYSLLKDIGWVGFADFDTIENPRTGELLIMELNPRVPACVKTAFESGVNWADVIVSEYLNEPHATYDNCKNVYLRHLGFEILWFLNAKDKWSTKPSWFKFFGKNLFYQDMSGWDDPLAFIYGTIGNIRKQLNPSFRKAKAGLREE